ncbi:hypothetical protein BT93_I0338 [Corymbia citriodora subsp. variegata]|nr:hypothetical protein BT93_I0338 [Corymbia citriodora subsp. variegata]
MPAREKALVPWKTSLGIPHLVAILVVQGRNVSETRQSGASCSINSSSCWSSSMMAPRNCLCISIEVSLFRLSESSGKPTSFRGNVTVTTSMSKPKSLVFAMDFKKVGSS